MKNIINNLEYIDIVLGICFFISTILYIREIKKNKRFVPPIASFIMWCIADILNLIFFKDFSQYWKYVLWPPIMTSAIIIASWKWKRKTILFFPEEKFLLISFGALSLLYIVLKIFIKEVHIGTITLTCGEVTSGLMQLMGIIGSTPMLLKVLKINYIRKESHYEPPFPWLICAGAWGIILVSLLIQSKNPFEFMYPIMGFIGNISVGSLAFKAWLKKDEEIKRELYKESFQEARRMLKKNFGLEISTLESYRLKEYVSECVEDFYHNQEDSLDRFSPDEALYRFLLYHYGYRMEWQTRLMYAHHLKIPFDEATTIFFQDMRIIQDHYHKI